VVKAVFVDYTGTVVKEGGPEMEEVVARICHGIDLHDPQQAVALWWSLVKQYEESCCGETYMTEDAIVDRILGELEKRIGLRENAQELHELIRGFLGECAVICRCRCVFLPTVRCRSTC